MSAPIGIEREIYKSQWKTAGRTRVRIRLDRALASSDFTDEFDGSSLNPEKWSSWKPANTSITVGGGTLTLSSTGPTNGFPVVQSLPGKTFPQDPSIGWSFEWTMSFPVITGYGVFFRICDIQNSEAIVAIKCNTADGLTLEMPDGTRKEELGADTGSHNYVLEYTPPTRTSPGQYELFRDTVSKGTLSATGRQAWYLSIGNGAVQVWQSDWTNISVSRVDVNLDSAEQQSWPGWTDKETIDGQIWGRIPYVASLSIGTHKRNDVDTAVVQVPVAGFITGLGYRSDLFAGFDWINREILIESQQSDGVRNTSWKKEFLGLCDEPSITNDSGQATLSITIREAVRRRAQMYHAVRGYSDNGSALAGLVMNKTWTQIIADLCQIVGLDASEYDILYDALKPRSWNVLGTPVLNAILEITDIAGVAVIRNAGQSNHGRMEVKEWEWGSGSPEIFFGSDSDIVLIDFAATDMGLTAQVVVTVQHSEFGEFSDIYPHAPVPPFGAVIRENAPIAQSAGDINSTRLLPHIRWKVLNRELKSIVVGMVGQDWIEHDIEAQVLDRRILRLAHDDYQVIDGWEYRWDADSGLKATAHLVHQDVDRTIRQLSLDRTVQVSY